MRQRLLTDEQEAEAYEKYLSGMNTTQLGAEYGVSKKVIWDYFKRNNRILRNNSECKKLFPLDESAFDKITTESAYWVGFLMADGAIVKSGAAWEVVLQLATVDREHVYKFKEFLKSGHKVSEVFTTAGGKKYPSCRFAVKSNRLAAALGTYGVVPRKTHYAKVSEELENNRDFWRGVIDGDGSLYWREGVPSVSIVGSFDLMTQYLVFVQEHVYNFKGAVRPHKKIYDVAVHSSHSAKLIRHLYEGATVYLERKMKKASELGGF